MRRSAKHPLLVEGHPFVVPLFCHRTVLRENAQAVPGLLDRAIEEVQSVFAGRPAAVIQAVKPPNELEA